MAESEEETLIKERYGLGEDVRVSVPGSRPKREPRAEGLGDMVARWTTAVGIMPCGSCHRRRRALNRAFPFRKK
jgi:hypothetical protein